MMKRFTQLNWYTEDTDVSPYPPASVPPWTRLFRSADSRVLSTLTVPSKPSVFMSKALLDDILKKTAAMYTHSLILTHIVTFVKVTFSVD